ncbi:MAG: alpha/beta hydrolase [Planctomycetota bacterium]
MQTGAPTPPLTLPLWSAPKSPTPPFAIPSEDPAPTHYPDPQDTPTLTLYPRDDQPRPCLIICPGGGYQALAFHEGEPVAKRFHDAGFHTAVLLYRLGPRHHHPAMLHDAQRAIRLLRARGTELGINSNGKISILGFSAGGHLAASAAIRHDPTTCAPCPDDDLAATTSARPDAAVMAYPVVHLAGPHAHLGSSHNLLGESPNPQHLADLDLPAHINTNTPPLFLWHTAPDPVAPQGSLDLAAACIQHGVPVDLRLYETGKHGLGLAPNHPLAQDWSTDAIAFLKRHLLP